MTGSEGLEGRGVPYFQIERDISEEILPVRGNLGRIGTHISLGEK